MSTNNLETVDPKALDTVTGGDEAEDAKAAEKVRSDAFNTCFTTPGPTFTACKAYAEWMGDNHAAGLAMARKNKVPAGTIVLYKDWRAAR